MARLEESKKFNVHISNPRFSNGCVSKPWIENLETVGNMTRRVKGNPVVSDSFQVRGSDCIVCDGYLVTQFCAAVGHSECSR